MKTTPTSVVPQEIWKYGMQLDLLWDQSPGTDRFAGIFFQKYWSTVGPTVIRMVNHFFTNGYMLKQMNHILLALIPKVDAPEKKNFSI